MKTANEKKHALYAASSAHRWTKCPGSIRLSKEAPPQKESTYAAEGTKAHEVLEKLLKAKFPYTEKHTLINDYPSEMVSHAWDAYSWISQLSPGSEILSEQKVYLDFIHKDMFGTLDCAVVEEFGTLHIVDYKYGAGYAVDPRDNLQLMFYALATAHRYDYNFQKAQLSIFQPRASHDQGPARSHSISLKEIIRSKSTFSKAVEKCEKKNAPLVSGDHCKWCPAATICPEISTRALKSARVAFDFTIKEPEFPTPESISLKKLGPVLDAIEKLETWTTAVRAHAFSLLESGETVQGYKLMPKRGMRKWAAPEQVQAQAIKEFGKEAVTKTELLSPAQLEKVCGKDWVDSRTVTVSSGMNMVKDK